MIIGTNETVTISIIFTTRGTSDASSYV